MCGRAAAYISICAPLPDSIAPPKYIKKVEQDIKKLIRTQMNIDHTDKMGIINKIKNLCLPRPPCEQGESGGSVQIRVPKT